MQLKRKTRFVQCVQKVLWLMEQAGDFSLDDAPRSGRLVEVNSNQIETLIESNQCYTTRNIADIHEVCKSIKLLVKMKSVFYFMEKTKWTLWATQ